MASQRETPPVYISGKIQVQKIQPGAEFPHKDSSCDLLYSLTLIGRRQGRDEDETGCLNDFTTGLRLTPPEGHFLEIVASPILHKSGYMLPGPIIIEKKTQDELVVSLYKIGEGEDLELPFACLDMIVRPAVYSHLYNNSKKSHRHIEYEGGNPLEITYNNRPISAPSKRNHMY